MDTNEMIFASTDDYEKAIEVIRTLLLKRETTIITIIKLNFVFVVKDEVN